MKALLKNEFRFFPIGVVRLRAIHWLADDEVVDEADLKEVGSFDEGIGKAIIRSAGKRLARGMVVGDDESIGAIDDDRLKNVARVGEGLIGGASGDFDHAFKLQSVVEGEDVEGFGSLSSEDGGEMLVDFLRAAQGDFVNRFANGAGAELESGHELAGFRESEAVFLAQLFDIE